MTAANITTVDPGAVDELERLYKLVRVFRSDVSLGGPWIEDKTFAELRERIAAGKTTVEDGPPAVEGDRLISIAEYVAEVSGDSRSSWPGWRGWSTLKTLRAGGQGQSADPGRADRGSSPSRRRGRRLAPCESGGAAGLGVPSEAVVQAGSGGHVRAASGCAPPE